ncbi:branched-chain amino acid ABC transporter permease [Acuticoccus kandeliae]|uniref:branched-chain amino acid ABC transporter permease n=1 Tax=Acuticoccus kandeliae TaxID=2073160 RepID=UPI000D3E3EF4|nr:branched-chain amino acid ABC transporter permease [Acuticoccus kandeliae]
MLLQLTLSGIAQGSIYALLALGMTLLFRATTVVNFGYGEMFMAGAFTVYVLLQIGMPFAVSALGAVAFLFLVGMVLERGLMRPLQNSPHMALAMMTVAFSFLFRGIARLLFGGEFQPMPPIFSFPPLELGGVIVTAQDLIIAGITLATVLLFFVLFNKTRLGKLAQAVSQAPRGAALVGINVPFFESAMWGVGAALGAIAGILVAPITLLYPDMGAQVLLKSFAAMTLGGFGHFGGAVIGGLLVGLIEQLAGGYISTAMIDISALLVIVIVLLVSPNGLLGKREYVRV